MVKILSDLETHIANNPMPPSMHDVFVESASPEETAVYYAIGGYIVGRLFAGEDVKRVNLVLQLGQRIDGMYI